MTGQRYKDELVTGEVNAASHYGPRAVESALPSEFAQSRGEYTIVVPFNAEGPHALLTGDNASILIPDLSYVQRSWNMTTEDFDDLAQAYDLGLETIDGVDSVLIGLAGDMVPGIAGTHGVNVGAQVEATLYATNPGTMWRLVVTPKAGAATTGSVNTYLTYSRGINDRADNFDS